MKFLRIAFEPTDRTDLLCISCNYFHVDLAIVGSDFYGVHKKCTKDLHSKRGSKVLKEREVS